MKFPNRAASPKPQKPGESLNMIDGCFRLFLNGNLDPFETIRIKVSITCVALVALACLTALFHRGNPAEAKIPYVLPLAFALVLPILVFRTRSFFVFMQLFFLCVFSEAAYFLSLGFIGLAEFCIWTPALVAVCVLCVGPSRAAFIGILSGIVSAIASGLLDDTRLSSLSSGSLFRSGHGPFLGSLLLAQGFLAIFLSIFERSKSHADRELQEDYVKNLEERRRTFVRELIGNVAHEINNPLAIIQASILRMELSRMRNDAPEYLEMIANIEQAVQRVSFVQEGLGLFAVGSKQEQLRTINATRLLQNVKEKLSYPEPAPAITFVDNTQGLHVLCRNQLITTAIIALIQNSFEALRHVAGGFVQVEAFLQTESFCIRVIDNGCGIPETLQNRIFMPFFSTDTCNPGKGLGLSVSRGIVVEHGGKLECSSRPGRTVFTMRLPLQLATLETYRRKRRFS